MNKAVQSFILILIAAGLNGQAPDAVSGATLKPGQMKQYKQDPVVRARYNNDNFDNFPAIRLKGVMPELSGEVLNPGKASTKGLLARSVVVKEIVFVSGSEEKQFSGAFRYTGFPLADLVSDLVVDKKNKDEFGLNLDLYVVVENNKGEMAVFSWGELFFSRDGKNIILATEVAPIFPTSSDDRWDIPSRIKIVAGNDLLSVRNIEDPVSIRVVSFPASFPGAKGSEIIAPQINIKSGERTIVIDKIGTDEASYTFTTAFFGLHMGLRRISDFSGYSFGSVLKKSCDILPSDLRSGLICLGASDGYRVVYSLSEFMNRDGLETLLLIDKGPDQDARFTVFPTGDFFADRQLKGPGIGYIINIEKMRESVLSDMQKK